MKRDSFAAIVRVLHEGGVRYLVAGGIAVVAHGYLRFTKDVDLVIDLLPENVLLAMDTLATLGYRPLLPVSGAQFADQATRETWVRDRGMQVFQLWSDAHRETPIDVFAYLPFPFDVEYERALVKPLYGVLPVRFVSIPTLIAMKEAAGREQDRVDIEHLRLRLNDDDRG